MRTRTWITLLVVFAGNVIPVQGGFLDNLVKKTSETVKQSVEQAVEEKVDKEVKKAMDVDDETEEAQEAIEATDSKKVHDTIVEPDAKEVATIAASDQPTTVKAISLAVVKVAPEIFDIRPENQIKELLLQIFPEENDIQTNEFYWHKNKDRLIASAKALSDDVPTTFEVAPWIDNSPEYGSSFQKKHYFQPGFGKYDFEKRAFPVYPSKLEIPWLAGYTKSNVGLFQFIDVQESKEYQWVEVPIDKAEKLTNAQGGSMKLYSHFIFTIESVTGLTDLEEHPQYETYKKYLNMGGSYGDSTISKLVPYFNISIKDNKVDLYVPVKPIYASDKLVSKADLNLFTTLDLSPTSIAANTAAH